MFGTLSQQEIEALLSRQIVGRLGCHANDITYVVPISYAYNGKFIYGHSYEGKKTNILRQNPKICFQVDDTRDLSNWQSVICWGVFEEIKNKEEKEEALKILNNRKIPKSGSDTMHITPDWPFSSTSIDTIPGYFFRIRLEEKTGKFERTSGQLYFGT